MWFGDLVTMRWWNGLWLKEAFATFMATVCTDAMKPDWHVWDTFGLDRTAALETDALESTRAIEYPVHSPHDAEGMYDVLTYEKGAAVLRMLEQYLGADEFRAGVQRVPGEARVRQHREHRSLGRDRGGRRASPSGGSWTPGSSRAAIRSCASSLGPDGGAALRLSQRRFVYSDLPDTTQWPVPLHVRQIGERRCRRDPPAARRRARRRRRSLAPDAVGARERRRPRLPPGALRGAAARPARRPGARGDVHDRALQPDRRRVGGGRRRARHRPRSTCSLARGFGDETTLPVWQALSAGLGFCDRLLDDPDAREQFRTFVRGLAGPALHRLGWTPAEGEDDLTGELRGLLIRTVAILGNDRDVQEKARALYKQSHRRSGLGRASGRERGAHGVRGHRRRGGLRAHPRRVRDVDEPAGAAASPLLARRVRLGRADGAHVRAHLERSGAQPERPVPPRSVHAQPRPRRAGVAVRAPQLGDAQRALPVDEHHPHARGHPHVDAARAGGRRAGLLLRARGAAGGEDARTARRAPADQRVASHPRVRPAGASLR